MFLLLIPQLFASALIVGSIALGNINLFAGGFADGMSGDPDTALEAERQWAIGEVHTVSFYPVHKGLANLAPGAHLDRTPCEYKTLVIPYDRTWAEEIRNGSDDTATRPPAPGKRAGFGYVLYRKDCEGQAPEAMFYVGESGAPPYFNHTFLAGDMMGPYVTFHPIVPTENDQLDPRYATQMPYVPRVVELLNAAAGQGDPNALEALHWTNQFTQKLRAALLEEARKKSGQGVPVQAQPTMGASPSTAQ
jgi:hypothetical protein